MNTSRFDYWASDSTYEYTLEKARECYDSGRYGDALIMYHQLMSTGVDADTYFEAGCCYHKLLDYERAIILFEKSLQLNERRWSALTRLADCYYKLKEYNKAIHTGMRARTLKPDDLISTLELSKYYEENNRLFESMYYRLKVLQSISDKRDENYKKISKTLSTARQEAERHANSAYRSLGRKELVPAQTSYLQALKIYPISYETNYNLAMVYRDLGKPQNAITHFMRALFLNPREKRIYNLIASEYSKLKDYTRAYCFVKRYLNTLITSANQTEYLNAMKNLKLLEPHINKDFKTNPDIYVQTNSYIEAYYDAENQAIISETGDSQKICEVYATLLFPEETLSKLYNKTGANLFNSGKIKEANKFFTRVMEISAKDSEEYKFAQARLS